jgi:hypothetical protein
MALIAFSPFVLLSWTATTEDKGLSVFLFVLTLVGLQQGRLALAWLGAILLFVLKFEGVVLVLPLAILTLRARGARPVLVGLGCFGLAAVVALPRLHGASSTPKRLLP